MKSIFMFLFAAIGFAACNNDTKTASKSAITKTDTSTTTDNRPTPLKTKEAASVDGLLTAYLQIKNALAADNANEAAAGGKAFVAALGRVDKSAMTADQQKMFDETADDAKEMAEHIGKSADKIAHQREHFEMLSEDVFDMVKTFKPAQTLYKDYCPMYNNGKGASWISETKDIKNPYLGKKMPTCGEVKEEMK